MSVDVGGNEVVDLQEDMIDPEPWKPQPINSQSCTETAGKCTKEQEPQSWWKALC